MKTATIEDVTQDEFDSAAQLVISGIKASDPRLDTRAGTVLRALLVNPEARIEATAAKQIEYVRESTSLKRIAESEEDGNEVDVDDVNAILSNFNVKSVSGTKAEGLVRVSVVDGEQSYTVPANAVFSTADGLEFEATSKVVAKAEGSGLAIASNAVLYKGASNYFFLVPVRASDVGSKYNVTQGTALTSNTSVYTLVSLEAYKTFCGGSDAANLRETIKSIPSGLSIRGFVNKNACEGMLRDEFDGGDHPIVACSVVGYGNSAQRRDKHNVFGVAVGGRIDLYVRNFGDLYTVTETVKGTKTADGEYEIAIDPSVFPGSCWVKSVSSVHDVNSSLEFSCARKAVGVDSTWHDIDVSKNPSEAFNTVWQGLSVTATEVPPDSTDDDDNPVWSEEADFIVTVYCLPEATELQEYVDRDDVRSVSTDVVVRCPAICNVSVKASVMYDVDYPIDVEDAKAKIRKYVNSLGFVGVLTRSEIVHILKQCGALSVDLSQQDMLYGTVHDANGVEYRLTGDALRFDGLADDAAMLTSDTAIFAVEAENISISTVPNR